MTGIVEGPFQRIVALPQGGLFPYMPLVEHPIGLGKRAQVYATTTIGATRYIYGPLEPYRAGEYIYFRSEYKVVVSAGDPRLAGYRWERTRDAGTPVEYVAEPWRASWSLRPLEPGIATGASALWGYRGPAPGGPPGQMQLRELDSRLVVNGVVGFLRTTHSAPAAYMVGANPGPKVLWFNGESDTKQVGRPGGNFTVFDTWPTERVLYRGYLYYSQDGVSIGGSESTEDNYDAIFDEAAAELSAFLAGALPPENVAGVEYPISRGDIAATSGDSVRHRSGAQALIQAPPGPMDVDAGWWTVQVTTGRVLILSRLYLVVSPFGIDPRAFPISEQRSSLQSIDRGDLLSSAQARPSPYYRVSPTSTRRLDLSPGVSVAGIRLDITAAGGLQVLARFNEVAGLTGWVVVFDIQPDAIHPGFSYRHPLSIPDTWWAWASLPPYRFSPVPADLTGQPVQVTASHIGAESRSGIIRLRLENPGPG